MEVSWTVGNTEEEELVFESLTPSPQPRPDLLVDLNTNSNHRMDEENNESKHAASATSKSAGETANQSQTTTTTTSSATTKVVKKKKSSTRSESISVEKNRSNLPDVFRGVSVERVRRSFDDLSQNNKDEDAYLIRKRPKSSMEFEQKSSMSKLNMLEEKNAHASAPLVQNGNAEEKKTEEKKLCKACGNQVFAMECLKAEKADWHKTCFRCLVCSKVLSVEAYSSHEGRLYCRPHFRELFQPKAALNNDDEPKINRAEVIIRESEPAPLPEGVVRASEPADKGLEDLHLDLKSKFQLFEKLGSTQDEPLEPPPQPKRSGSVLAKLQRYQSKAGMDLGVTDDALAGGRGPMDGQDSDEEVDNTRKPHILDEINSEAVDSVRNKWAQGALNNRSESISEHRKEEQSKFRSRLLLGKNIQLKEMYEKAVEAGDSPESKTSLSHEEILSSEKSKEIKEMFEKGNFKEKSGNESKLEGEVFDSAIAKQSRELFKELDKGGATAPPPKTSMPKPKRIDRTESISSADVVRSSDVIEEIVKPTDIGSKFKFFEDGGHIEKAPEKRQFRITPPRDQQDENNEHDVEIYRDPSIVRSCDSAEPAIPVTRTASKMLSVFRQLEQQGTQDQRMARPLKEFTPPREPLRPTNDEEEESDEDSADSPPPAQFKDDALQQVGSLARASSLRAKFERWETEENERNGSFEKESPSIESTKDLRAKFENLKREEEEKLQKRREVKVNRFVVRQ